jgi:hypothetical protein
MMSPTKLLLRAYYERLHELMASGREELITRIDELLSSEFSRAEFGPVDRGKQAAYREAALAFIDERLESYDPIGIQYTFDRVNSRQAAELEFQLNWYGSRGEFEELVEQAQTLAQEGDVDEALPQLVDELIRRAGAFPDRSIVAAYRAAPALQKLPDYVVACAIEHLIHQRRPPA